MYSDHPKIRIRLQTISIKHTRPHSLSGNRISQTVNSGTENAATVKFVGEKIT